MNNTGSAASILAASQQASFSPIASSGVGGANLQAAAAPVSQGQSQQLPAIQSGMLVNAAPVFQGNIQPGQPNIQAQVQPLPVPPIDYIEHCQADEEAQRATAQCKNAASQPLPAAPLFKCDPTNDTVIRRTLGGILLGSTDPQRLRDRDEAATGSQHPSSTIEQVWGITTSTRNASSGIKYIKDNKPTILERYV
ncbi:hypothetical protein EYC84_007522 [Monilinia fructicola]|uniref:Uncharacterized protein n=1 Tax=Monilinia fructicola TaxID=38448 RepID=A0A5M9JGT3_MONFR|nr:hypothetical protein EYC84_007522 [Monilinia fructicola]